MNAPNENAKWPRSVWCCLYPGCGYVQARGAAMGETCPAHGTALCSLLLQPVVFEGGDRTP